MFVLDGSKGACLICLFRLDVLPQERQFHRFVSSPFARGIRT